MKKSIETPNAPKPIGPYSQAVWAGNVLYLSGMIAINPKFGDLKMSNLEEETHTVMKNIGEVLKAAGLTYVNVIKCSIFIKNMDDFSRINEVYAQYFEPPYPARETVEVARLPKDVNIEISVVAMP